jgi:hypothetical protein
MFLNPSRYQGGKMSIKNERENQALTDLERDSDIHVLSTIQAKVNSIPGAGFVLTGSYATEALTGVVSHHDDMDANVFTSNLSRDISKVAEAISGVDRVRKYKRTTDRLEYDVQFTSGDVTKKLELQFIDTIDQISNCSGEFTLKSDGERPIKVPVSSISLRDSMGMNFSFLVKSLPYANATWAIRISGYAVNPKRPVRESDLKQFILLLKATHETDAVIAAIKAHPQTPAGIPENQILTQAINIVSQGVLP